MLALLLDSKTQPVIQVYVVDYISFTRCVLGLHVRVYFVFTVFCTLTIFAFYYIFRPPVYGSNGRTYKMLVMFFLFRHAFSEIPRPIALKLGHMVGNWLD